MAFDLARFDTCTRADPLFAAEGMDLDSASCAIDEIEKHVREIERLFSLESLWRKLFFMRAPLTESATPLTFLRTFIESERVRREYLKTPSEHMAKKLQSAWVMCAKEYSLAVGRYRKLHDTLLALEKAGPCEFCDTFGNVNAIADIERTLEMIGRNAGELLREAQDTARESRIKFGSEKLIYGHGTMSDLHGKLHALEVSNSAPFRHSKIEGSDGPFLYTLRHFDGKPQKHAFMSYALRDNLTGIRSFWLNVVDLFLYMPRGRTQTAAFEGPADADVPLWYQPAANMYTTRDPRYWAEIASAVDMKQRPHLDRALVCAEKSSAFDKILGALAQEIRLYKDHVARWCRIGTLSTYSPFRAFTARTYPALFFLTFNASVWRLPDQPDFLGTYDAGKSPYVTDEALAGLESDMIERIMTAHRRREEIERTYPAI